MAGNTCQGLWRQPEVDHEGVGAPSPHRLYEVSGDSGPGG